MSEYHKKFLCPRLLDYIVIVGSRHPNNNNNVAQTPELLRRYPLEDHSDFPLPTDVIFFCQPEGCISVGPKRMSLRETTSFVFTLTEKDSGKVRYGICVNFFRPFERHKSDRKSDRQYSSGSYGSYDGSGNTLGVQQGDVDSRSPRTNRKLKTASRVRNNTLTSLCIISHHPFFSTFRECLFILRRLIDACHERSCTKRIGGSRSASRETVWGVLTGQGGENVSSLVVHEVREIETWILHLLSSPVPVPGKTRVEVPVLPRELQPPLLFALPDHTRFSLIDFPLHLPLELLGVETCLKVLTAIMLEFKVVMQSRDYNALTMSVMAFVSMLYPMEYMFPVIPLLPTCMSSAEQLLLAPTPFLIGVPASFFLYKKDFTFPEDIWLVDLDSNKITPASVTGATELPSMPEPEGTILKNHLKQALASMSMTPQPIKNLDVIAQNPDMWKRRESFSSQTGFNPLIYGNDVDSVDVATRVAMVRFFNSPNTLGNFSEHTRTLRLYPRPVVAFQMYSFLKSRPVKSHFTHRLARTQAVEFFGEWSLCPQNVVFLRVQTSVFDPLLIGDKAKWYAHQLQPIDFKVYDDNSSLGAALNMATDILSDEFPTDESGSDSDGADSTSSSYSSLSDFVTDMVNSEIDGDTPSFLPEHQVLAVDESKVYFPPDKLQLPDTMITNSDSAFSMPDSDDAGDSDSDSSAPASPAYAPEPDPEPISLNNPRVDNRVTESKFRYDSGNITPVGKNLPNRTNSQGSDSPPPERRRPPLQPLNKSINSAFEAYEKPPSPRNRAPPSPRDKLPPSPRDRVPPVPRERSYSGGSRGPPASPRDRAQPSSPRDRGVPSSPRDRAPPSPRDRGSPGLLERAISSPKDFSPLSPKLPRVPPPSPVIQHHPRFGSQGSQGSQENGNSTHSKSNSLRPSQILRTVSSESRESDKGSVNSDRGSTSSIITSLSNDLTDLAHNASSTLSEFFGGPKGGPNQPQRVAPPPKPFAPLGNRKALVEKSGLVKHATNKSKREKLKQQSESKGTTNSENQQFLKEVVSSVLEGQGISWLKHSRVKKLLEDENYRNFVVSRLNRNLDKKLTDEDHHIEDVAISKAVYKGMLSLMKAFIHGLETTFQNYGLGGMASAYMVLEIAHTHCWTKEHLGSNKSDTSLTPELNSPYGSQESLSMKGNDSPQKSESRSLNEETMVAALGYPTKSENPGHSRPGWWAERPREHIMQMQYSTVSGSTELGSPVIVNGDEFENIEIVPDDKSEKVVHPYNMQSTNNRHENNPDMNKNITNTQKCDIIVTGLTDKHGNPPHPLMSPDQERDVMLDLVKNKGLMRPAMEDKRVSSIDSEMSEASTLMHKHGKGRSSSVYSNKSSLSAGSRYREGHVISTSPIPGSPEVVKIYLFEGLISKDRSRLWDQMQFWEDVFLDAVAQERDIIGMDQGPAEMMERYNSLGGIDRKRLEHDEDRLLSVMLYNLVGYMVMMRVNKDEIKKKIRRLLGKSHIGLQYSQEINNLLDEIASLHGNDIDLRPMGSRFMQKQSFTVHWGSDNKGDMLFMEVCDDCIILRSVTGAICDRWWYEKLVNMTYCPKTKVLCLWRKNGEKVQLNQFYTKKCRELYFCVKEAMEKAAARNNSKIPGPELGGEFPVQDVKSGQGGLLQVCMEGIGLLLSNSKSFIELGRIKKCFTMKGGIFILEEFDSKRKQVVQHRFQSNMAGIIGVTLHRIIAIQMAKVEQALKEKRENGRTAESFLCACFGLMTSLGFVFSMPTTSSEPDMTSQPPEQEYTSESHTTLLSPLLDIDTTKLNVLRNLAIHVQIYSSEHFYKLLESRLLSDSSEEMYRSIVDMGRKKYGQEMIPENILVAAKSCSNIEAAINTVIAVTKNYIKLYEEISNSDRYRQTDNSTLIALRSLYSNLSKVLNDPVQEHQSVSEVSSKEAERRSKDFYEVLTTIASVMEQMVVSKKIFVSLSQCV